MLEVLKEGRDSVIILAAVRVARLADHDFALALGISRLFASFRRALNRPAPYDYQLPFSRRNQ
jgi:hypothetical protein